MRGLLLPLLGVLLAGSCTEEHRVRLVFSPAETLATTPLAYRCFQKGTTEPMLRRAFHADTAKLVVTFCVDFIDTDGVPICRAGPIAEWCDENDCRRLSDQRVCVEREAPVRAIEEVDGAMVAMLKSLPADVTGAGGAPDVPVMVRVVATTQPLAQITGATAFDPTLLVGCATTCPVNLDFFDDKLLLALDAARRSCEDEVRDCADDEFGVNEAVAAP